MKLALFGIMFVSMAIMFWLAYEYRMKGEAKVKWAAVMVAFISLGAAITSLSMDYWLPQLKYKEFKRRHVRTQRVAHRMLGEKVAELHEGGRMVVVEYDDTLFFDGRAEQGDDVNEPPVFEAFESGLNGRVSIEARIKVVTDSEGYYMEDPVRRSPPGNFYSVELLNAILDKYKDCDVLMLLVGLPLDHETKFKLWTIKEAEKRPSLILLNTSPNAMKKAVRKGYVSLLMTEVPVQTDFEKPLPESDQELFDSRFLLVTKKNLDEVTAAFPKLFE